MRNYLPFIVALAILASCSEIINNQEDLKEAKGSLFIIGGGSRPTEMVNRIIDESGLRKSGYAIILPMSSSVPDSAIIWASEQFIQNGIEQITGFNFLPGGDIPLHWIDSLKNASLIYISGGDQNRFMSIAGGTAIEDAIHHAWQNGAMIAGTSAGAAVMSEKMITGNELRYPEYSATFRTIESENLEIGRGLGFITTAIIDQHFIWRSRHNRLFSAVMEHPDMLGIGIDESTAILVRGNMAEVVGVAQVLVFRNPDASLKEKDGKMGARNLIVDIYLEGERFSIN